MGLGVSLGQRCGPRGDDEWCLVNPVPGESELMSSSITTALGPCLLLLGGGGRGGCQRSGWGLLLVGAWGRWPQ